MEVFRQYTGADILKKNNVFGFILVMSIAIAVVLSKIGILVAGGVIVLFGVAWYLRKVFESPRVGIISLLIASFLAMGIVRFVKGPFGLSIDLFLILTILSTFIKGFKGADWSPMKNPLTIASLIWMGYNILEIANPEARSLVAWFYAVRSVALYMILLMPLVFLVFNKKEDFKTFINIWFLFSIAAALYGMKQNFLGVNHAEQMWLNAGAADQHILFGKLRVFSFYSDAGQFGAAQGQVGTTAIIFALLEPVKRRRYFYWITGVLSLYGMAISGTRGALFIPIAGFFIYFFLSKNIKVILLGMLIGGSAFYMLKYTYIMQSNYTVARMRSALDPNDASLQVRLENQRALAVYMSSRPFGGGVGTAGFWGLRFSPNTFLAQTPTDSWYVRIWAEEGVIGLTLYLLMYAFILGNASLKIWKMKDPVLRQKAMGLVSGICGLMVANYANGYMGQIPSSVVVFISLPFIYILFKWDKGEEYPEFGKKEEL